eukprot:scaffold1676_cov373-Prasinococcus_capsulatus_cf.AAC.6
MAAWMALQASRSCCGQHAEAPLGRRSGREEKLHMNTTPHGLMTTPSGRRPLENSFSRMRNSSRRACLARRVPATWRRARCQADVVVLAALRTPMAHEQPGASCPYVQACNDRARNPTSGPQAGFATTPTRIGVTGLALGGGGIPGPFGAWGLAAEAPHWPVSRGVAFPHWWTASCRTGLPG